MERNVKMKQQQKHAQRDVMKHLRDSIPDEEAEKKSTGIIKTLEKLPEYTEASVVLMYAAKGKEVRTKALIESAITNGKKVLLPITNLEAKRMEIGEVNDHSDLREGAFGIMEPGKKSGQWEEKIEAAIVPGLAFDMEGHRIGYGHGYYDGMLKRMRAVRIGLAYDFQIVEMLPAEGHDQSMDLVVTERRVIRC